MPLVKDRKKIRWRLKGCEVCGGDLRLEWGEYRMVWKCLQCSRESKSGFKPIGYTTGRRDKWE